MASNSKAKEKPFNTSRKMLDWQYFQILGELTELQRHASDPTCPCRLSKDLGENCLAKHSLGLSTLAAETAAMDKSQFETLMDLSAEAKEKHEGMRAFLCNKKDEPEIMEWARQWRKKMEPLYYYGSCKLELKQETVELHQDSPTVCTGINTADKALNRLSSQVKHQQSAISDVKKQIQAPLNVCKGQFEMFKDGALDPYGSRCRGKDGHWLPSGNCDFQPRGNKTLALGPDNTTQYEFEFRIVPLDTLIVSNDPFTFTVNPAYPQELQPRLRERAATQLQVERIAADLKPDALITDFHAIDRGTPITGPDMVVEAGNGRVMGLKRAAKDYAANYAGYVDALRERINDYGLSKKDLEIENPVLIRVRLTDVDRVKFTQDANAMATISTSSIENARTDAANITLSMVKMLEVGENESLEDALRTSKNQPFAKQFLSTLPANVQASLVDAKGYLNRDGVHRMTMAVFVSAFPGDTGLRLAEKAFESVDMDVRSVINAISRSLGRMAEAESLVRSGERSSEYAISNDLAQTVVVYAAIKTNPALSVEKYLNQSQLFARELTPFQEGLLRVIDQHRRSAKKLSGILTAYADAVIKLPPPSQGSLMPLPSPTKAELWDKAVMAGEVEAQPAMMMQEKRKLPAVCKPRVELHNSPCAKASAKNERAFTICKCGNNLVKGSEATGTPSNVRINPSCPCGEPVGFHHTHPGGTPELSNGDLKAAETFSKEYGVSGVLMCVTVPETKESKCYEVIP
jgi:proteasome lid subunit RPN8/RPN11